MLKQDKIIKSVRITFIILITVFLGLSAYNSITKTEKTVIVTVKRDACNGCPNMNQCSKNKTEKSCNINQSNNEE